MISRIALQPVQTGEISLNKPVSGQGGQSFATLLNDAIGKVNDLQIDAQNKTLQMAAGQIEDVSQVMIATEKASMALNMAVQVRNKVVDAYQEIMRMQV